MKPLRQQRNARSTNPRGGVAHALASGEALHDWNLQRLYSKSRRLPSI
jgi:hypothetical protein